MRGSFRRSILNTKAIGNTENKILVHRSYVLKAEMIGFAKSRP